MAVLKKDEGKLPVWGAKYAVVSGLDPLGLQNASDAAFAALLPGVTNLTNHIRYYGLYCWLLEHYAQHIKHTAQVEQNRFIRRAELITALMMGRKAPEVQQIMGSNFVARLYRDHEGGTFDLASMADKDSGQETYWKYSSGGYGQYYAGALREIGLNVLSDAGNFICSREEHHATINGVRLAASFRANIPDAVATRFLACIERGRVTVADLDAFHPSFAMAPVPTGTAEWEDYASLLMDVDHPLRMDNAAGEPGQHRRQTLLHLLRFLNEEKDDFVPHRFTRAVHRDKGALLGVSDDTLMGWYYYQANEYWHYAMGCCLYGALQWLHERGGVARQHGFADVLASEAAKEFRKKWSIAADVRVEDALERLPGLEELAEAMEAPASPGEDLANGVAVLLALYRDDAAHVDALRQAVLGLQAERPGSVFEGLRYVKDRLAVELSAFLPSLLHDRVIMRHTQVAFRKLATVGTFTLKFLMEDGMVRLVDRFPPQYTSPRLRAVIHILEDLGMMDKQHALTDLGRRYMVRLQA